MYDDMRVAPPLGADFHKSGLPEQIPLGELLGLSESQQMAARLSYADQREALRHGGIDYRNPLVLTLARKIERIVQRYQKKGVPDDVLDDMRQVGMFSLLKAARRYDLAEENAPFSDYATLRANGYLGEWLKQYIRYCKRYGADMPQDGHGRTASSEDIVLKQKEQDDKRAIVLEAIKKLDDREQDILIQRRLKDDPTTLDELSKVYGVSIERIRQIEVAAFEKLQYEAACLANSKGYNISVDDKKAMKRAAQARRPRTKKPKPGKAILR